MISFILPAHNEAPLLGETLLAVHAAAAGTGLPHEVIVVDDASTDATAAVAAAHGARCLRVEHRHIAATRNAGARAAVGEVLMFIDADTHIDAGVVTAAIAALDAGAPGGGAGLRLHGRPAWHERLVVACVSRAFRAVGIAPGCFVYCTRTAFDAVGGFDERYYAAEDVAMSRALARLGRIVILRQQVSTSDRKLRTHSLWEHLRLVFRFVARGTSVLKSRRDLDLWYGGRRHDA